MPARPDDQVIHDRYPEKPPGGDGILRRPEIVGRRLGVAGRVVVPEDDARGISPEGFGEELADPDRRPGDVAGVDRAHRDEPLLAGEEGDDERFAIAVREVRRERARGRRRRVEDVALALGGERPSRELERRDDAGRGGRPEAESREIRSRQTAGPAGRLEYRLGEREGGPARAPRADDEREQLRVGEGWWAVADQALAGADRLGPVADRHVRLSYRLRLDGARGGAYSSAMVREPLLRLLVLLSAFVALTVLVGTGATDAVDGAMLALLLPLRSTPGDAAFGLITLVGDPILSSALAIAVAAVFVTRGDRRGWLVLLFFAGFAIEIVLKQIVFQPGPPSELVRDSALLPMLRNVSPYTYPGGHVMRIAFLSTVIASRYPRFSGTLAGFTALVAFGQIYLAAGWPADVLGGLIAGVGLATVVDAIAERAREQRVAPAPVTT